MPRYWGKKEQITPLQDAFTFYMADMPKLTSRQRLIESRTRYQREPEEVPPLNFLMQNGIAHWTSRKRESILKTIPYGNSIFA